MGNTSQPTLNLSEQVTQVYALCTEEVKRSSVRVSSTMHKGSKSSLHQKVSKEIIVQLFQSFERMHQYSWGEEMLPLFRKHFLSEFHIFWKLDCEKFYHLLCENYGFSGKPRFTTYQTYFYQMAPSLLKFQINMLECEQQIKALNSSILEDDPEALPLFIEKKLSKPRYHSVGEITLTQELKTEESQIPVPTFHRMKSEIIDSDIERSSVIIPETIFIDRLDESSKQKVSEMLNLYKGFSNSLQMMIKTINVLSCPLKHFEASLNKKLKRKKISKISKSLKVYSESREAVLLRKTKQANNSMLLIEIRNFIDAYTEFLWKYLDLFEMSEGSLGEIISVQIASGVVLKVVWSFAGWIGERGFEWEEMQLGNFAGQSNKFSQSIIIPENVIKLTCEMRHETNPQKYLKRIVVIYRELSQICENADQLLSYYEKLIFEVIKRNCHHKIFRMQSIIEKLMKMDCSGGEIGYAWTTWNIIIEFLKKKICDI